MAHSVYAELLALEHHAQPTTCASVCKLPDICGLGAVIVIPRHRSVLHKELRVAAHVTITVSITVRHRVGTAIGHGTHVLVTASTKVGTVLGSRTLESCG